MNNDGRTYEELSEIDQIRQQLADAHDRVNRQSAHINGLQTEMSKRRAVRGLSQRNHLRMECLKVSEGDTGLAEQYLEWVMKDE